MSRQDQEERQLLQFEKHLREEEKSCATIEKYLRDVRCFYDFLKGRKIDKAVSIAYKQDLIRRYAPASVNSMLAALNGFLRFTGRQECCVKPLRIQRQLFLEEQKELSRAEYQRLLRAAAGRRIALVIQTICSTGIRVSELEYITVKAVKEGKSVVHGKNKTRVIFIPGRLQSMLKRHIRRTGIKDGAVFVSRNGKPLNRSNIWRDMKQLCRQADVLPEKVFPHNLRHLFACTFYGVERDLVKLSDLLGHSSINTTRIYTMETGKYHKSCLEQVERLLVT